MKAARIWCAACCGKGYGTDALDALCLDLHRRFGVQDFMVQPSARNPRAIHAYEKIGFVRLGLPIEEARALWVARFESLYIQALLRRTGGNVTRTAQLAGVNRRWLQRLIAQLGLRAAPAPGGEDDEEGCFSLS